MGSSRTCRLLLLLSLLLCSSLWKKGAVQAFSSSQRGLVAPKIRRAQRFRPLDRVFWSTREIQSSTRVLTAVDHVSIGATENKSKDIAAFPRIPPSNETSAIVGADTRARAAQTLRIHKLSVSPWMWINRSAQIFFPIGWFVIRVLVDRVTQREQQNRQARAEQLLHYISAQSPALIKAGQSLSSRSDLLPKEYLLCMQTLQDRCPSFPNEQAFAVFEEESHRKFFDVFELEQEQPVAAASIGQVYKGRIKATGELVAIKIQRPHCEELISADLSILRWYGKRFQDLLGALKKNIDMVTIIDEFGELLFREIDYRVEASNVQRFAKLNCDVSDIYVPKVYSRLSSKSVLVMEWVDGVRLNDKDALNTLGLDGSKLVNILVQSTLRQMLDHGFFHADPHAGNLLALPNGKVCYLDFGMVATVELNQRNYMIEAVIHMVNRDFQSLAQLFQRMGFVPLELDLQPLISALENALPDVLSTPVSEFNFKNVFGKLGDVMYRFPFSLPPYYISIMRCLGVLEGLAMQIDQNFRVVHDAYPSIAARLLTDSSPELQRALLNLVLRDGRINVPRLEDLLDHAATQPNFDCTPPIERLIAFLSTEDAREIRETIAAQVIDGFDALEDEVLEVLLKMLNDPLLSLSTFNSLVFTTFQDRQDTSLLRRVDALLGRVFSLLVSAKSERVKLLRSLVKTIRLVARSLFSTNSVAPAQRVRDIASKIMEERLFRDLIARSTMEILRRASYRATRRFFDKATHFFRHIFG